MSALFCRIAERGWPLVLATFFTIPINWGLRRFAPSPPSLTWALLILSWSILMVMVIVLGYIAIRKMHHTWHLPPIMRAGAKLRHIIIALPFLLGGVAHSALVAFVLDIDILARYQAQPGTVLSVIAVMGLPYCVLALCEEIVFRGYLLTWFESRVGTVGGLAGSALMFAIYHLHSDHWSLVFAVLGLALAVIVRLTGSLFHATAYHVGYNVAVAFIDGLDLGAQL